MISSIELSAKSIDYLNRRQLSQDEISDFASLLNKTRQQAETSHASSKNILSQLSAAELTLLKKANALADDIQVASLSDEGATNLLRQPDNSDRVDLNNDGIVEVGVGRNMVFPPVNAPAHVKLAWEKATTDMSESDVMHLQLTMHLTVFGIQIDGQNHTDNPLPEQQWSNSGIDNLFATLKSGLDFRVQQEGWSEYNTMLKGFYARFEQALSGQTSTVAALTANKAAPATILTTDNNSSSSTESSSEPSSSSTKQPLTEQQKSQRMIDLMQSVLDARIGLDREKLKEIEAQIKETAANDKLDGDQKKQLIEQLEKLKEAFFDTFEKKLVDDEKRKATLNAPSTLLNALTEDLLKSELDKKTLVSS